MKKIIRTTPQTVNSPVGKYAHMTKIPSGMDWYTFSGQVGVDQNGEFSVNMNDQIEQTFRNMTELLSLESIDVANITKINIWAVETIDWDFFYEQWDSFFNHDYPSMTIAYVKGLGLEEIKIEIEMWAVK